MLKEDVGNAITRSFVWLPVETLSNDDYLDAWLTFARTVEWHHTPLNICSSALPAQHNTVANFLKLDNWWKGGVVGYNNINGVVAFRLIAFRLIGPPVGSTAKPQPKSN